MSEQPSAGRPGSRTVGHCPSCGRPIALAAPRCLYCNAALPAGLVRQSVATSVPAGALERRVLILDVSADAAALAAALGRQITEADALKRRARPVLHRILPSAEAQAEVTRLAGLGVGVVSLEESRVREAARPRVASGGDPARGIFRIEADARTCHVAPSDVLLVLWGRIRREPQSTEPRSLRELRRVSWARVNEDERFHLHVRSRARPIEIDPSAFTFAEPGREIESTLLRVKNAIHALVPEIEIDLSFRHEAPVMGVSEVAALSSLASTLTREAEDPRRAHDPLLDNLSQFRFYSAWRGGFARRQAGLPETNEPPL